MIIWICVSAILGVAYAVLTISGEGELKALLGGAVSANLLFVPLLSFVAGIGTVARHVMWRVMGYKGTPIIFFGVMVYSRKTRFVWDITFPFEPFVSADILSEMAKTYDDSLLKTRMINAEYVSCVSVYLSLSLFTICAALVHSMLLTFAGIMAITVIPAHAGVILVCLEIYAVLVSNSRICGGDSQEGIVALWFLW